MTWQTPYDHYSDEELLSRFDNLRPHSPVIEELCQRLEKRKTITGSGFVECPVCESDLRVEYDQGNDLFEVEIKE